MAATLWKLATGLEIPPFRSKTLVEVKTRKSGFPLRGLTRTRKPESDKSVGAAVEHVLGFERASLAPLFPATELAIRRLRRAPQKEARSLFFSRTT